jgi:hypothetical protein
MVISFLEAAELCLMTEGAETRTMEEARVLISNCSMWKENYLMPVGVVLVSN